MDNDRRSSPGRGGGARTWLRAWRVPLAAAVLVTGAACDEGGGQVDPAPTARRPEPRAAEVVYDVRPGEEIQPVLERAAADAGRAERRRVVVHAGTYHPRREGQALIWFNARHDGIVVEAEGEVVLTAANPDLADPEAESYPAVVNHVVYFGDGVTSATVLRGFRITGANHFVTRSEAGGVIEPFSVHPELRKELFFYADGGAIKVFGRSYPTLEALRIDDNFASPCAGGISIEHRGFIEEAVTIRDCVFRGNRCGITGSAIDVLPGSAALVENCLFVGNVSNTEPDSISGPGLAYNREHGSGSLTVFEGSRAVVRRCTFTGNWNGVDDRGRGNRYEDSIFWMNTRPGGISPGARYEMDLIDGSGVSGCILEGEIADVRGTIDGERNVIGGPDPDFDADYRPRAAAYRDVGYRPREEKRP